MKTKNQMKPLARLIATSLAVGSMAGFGAQAFAATAAGTLIKNLATVTYEDENGNEYSAQSNEAVVTVAPVPKATVEGDNSLSGAPGQTVYFPHTVSNTGNTSDSYKFSLDNIPADNAVVYHDLNGNGQPDPGEPELSATDLIEVAAGDKLHVVVALPIPTDAVEDAELTSKLTVKTSDETSFVEDIGDNSDNNPVTAAGTVDNKVVVSTGPVLVLNKSSVHDVANNQITYTLTVKNNGGSDAENVHIVDALPRADTNGDGTLDTQTTLVSIDVNGLVNGDDDVPTTTETGTETSYGDLNNDGVIDTRDLNLIVAKDATLPANTTVTVVYTVSYLPTWAAGLELENTFISYEDSDGNGLPENPTTEPPVSSNTTVDVIPQIFDVSADDTGVASAVNDPNDGGDDDSINNIQHVDVAATGAEVLFQHKVENKGNGEDIFNLDVINGSATTGFPEGTVFTFWDATGTVQLTDTDDDGVPDTGVLDSAETATIMVKAKLPAGVSGTQTGGYNASLTAISSKDPDPADPFSTDAAATGSDVTGLRLGEITPPTVDVANKEADQGATVADGFNDGGTANAQDEAPAVLKDGVIGGKVTFDMKLANESGSADSFTLDASNVPEGWDVVFKDSSGNIITTTALVPGGGVFEYTAEVTISSDPAEALSNSDRVNDVNGYDAKNNGTANPTVDDLTTPAGDEDKDYQINFNATSTSTAGLSDTVTNAIDVTPEREVVITPSGQNQVQPGGTVDYSHKVENNGNQVEVVELDVANTQPGWTTVVTVDGVVLNVPTAANPVVTIPGVDDDGNAVVIEVTDTDGDGIPELNLEPGENVNIITTVNAPANSPLGAVDLSTISVTEVDNTPIVSAEDQTSVILGQVRLDKAAAIDSDCDGTPNLNMEFLANQTAEVKPGECVVWELTATNEGTATVKNVVISDAAPEFTDVVTGLLKFCHGNACTPVGVGDSATDGDAGTYANGLVNFFAGNGDDTAAADPANGKGGELISGEQATGQFTVKVQ